MVGLPTSATASIAVSTRPRVAAHLPVPDDVLDDDDGVVDENADREDQREQADAVDRVAHHPGGEERQQDRRRDDDEDDDALAPADRRGDEHDDRDGGEREMEQQLVGLLVRGLAVVARDRDVEVRRNDAALDVSRRCMTSSATTTALAPLRLAMAMLTAGRRSSAPLASRVIVQARCSSSAAPTTTSATSLT